MKLLEDRIIQTGRIINNEILKVDNFLNHQIDVNLINQIGKDIASIYPNANKVVTIETSGQVQFKVGGTTITEKEGKENIEY